MAFANPISSLVEVGADRDPSSSDSDNSAAGYKKELRARKSKVESE